MFGGSPSALAARFARLVERLAGDMAAAKAQGQQRELLAAVERAEPATLNQIAAKVKRGRSKQIDTAPKGITEQYRLAKERHPGMVLLFRVGDFYEAFGEDAKLASQRATT